MHGRQPDESTSLDALIGEGADIVVIGFQEIVPLNPSSVLTQHEDPSVRKPWDDLISSALGKGHRKVSGVQLVGIYMSVWCNERSRDALRTVSTCSVPTGVLNVFGNKGGVGIWLELKDTQMALVCVHLSSGHKPASKLRRNADVAEVLSKAEFGETTERKTATSADMCILFGDFNYRIALHDQRIRNMASQGRYREMVAYDELSVEQARKGALSSWHEGTINFAPTYKLQIGKDEYAGGEGDDDKKRPPAWTDRILYRSARGDIELNNYESFEELRLSDHKAVRAAFSLTVRQIEPKRARKCADNARQKADLREMELVPRCKLGTHSLSVDGVKLAQPVSACTTIHNIGSVPAHFSIHSPEEEAANGDAGELPAWISIWPRRATLNPGESDELTATVLLAASHLLCATQMGSALDMVAVISVDGGGDEFLSVEVHPFSPAATAMLAEGDPRGERIFEMALATAESEPERSRDLIATSSVPLSFLAAGAQAADEALSPSSEDEGLESSSLLNCEANEALSFAIHMTAAKAGEKSTWCERLKSLGEQVLGSEEGREHVERMLCSSS